MQLKIWILYIGCVCGNHSSTDHLLLISLHHSHCNHFGYFAMALIPHLIMV